MKTAGLDISGEKIYMKKSKYFLANKLKKVRKLYIMF